MSAPIAVSWSDRAAAPKSPLSGSGGPWRLRTSYQTGTAASAVLCSVRTALRPNGMGNHA